MEQTESRTYLIQKLLSEKHGYENAPIPADEREQKRLLRALFNIRMPNPISNDFLDIQDKYLQEETAKKGITRLEDLTPVRDHIYLWQGDITTIACDAIVNAANNQMLGCFCPCHGCIDNAIHTYAGVQLRLACAELMKNQDYEETGRAKITPAYNLPCNYVIHTVGPIVNGALTQKEEDQLASCYLSCIELAEQNGLESIAFCCISTGEFFFPNDRAAEIAIETITNYIQKINSKIKVIFNVFKDLDYEIYSRLLK